MAEKMNEYFVNVGQNLQDKIPPGRPFVKQSNDDETSFKLHDVKYEDISKLLRAISPSKACGVDGLTARLIKACGEAIVAPLQHIFNISILTCTFPTIWKNARVTPLYKSGALNDPSNYRPVSVLPILSKILERLIHDQIYDYVTNAAILTSRQSGFRRKHSTGTCLIEFLDAVYNSMEEGSLSGVLFLDLRKAFDTVDHQVLICKLSEMNMSDTVLCWIDSYLSSRNQLAKVNGAESEYRKVNFGVPQGSILGPLLFVLYINSLPSVIDSEVFLYADDTAILVKGDNFETIKEKLLSELRNVSTWMIDHRLSLNVDKTKAMFFGTQNRLAKINEESLPFEDTSVEIVDQFKYLGLILDCKLTFSKHVEYVCKKVYPKLRTLGRIRQYISTNLAIYMYKSLINPIFAFNDHVYDAMSKKDTAKLQVMQNNCLRTCLQCDRLTSRETLYTTTGVPKLESQRQLSTATTVYQGLNQNSTPFINNLFEKLVDTRGRVTRSVIRDELIVPHCKLETCKKNIRVRGPVLYNTIPMEIREQATCKRFKHNLKIHMGWSK